MVPWLLEPWMKVDVTMAVEAQFIKILVTSLLLNIFGRSRKC